MSDLDQLLKQKSKHWLDQGPEETPLACPDCQEPFGHLGLLDGFDLSKEEFATAAETEMAIVREHIPPIVITCPHCGSEHDVNRMGVWIFLLMCLWEALLDMQVIDVEGGFAAFLRYEDKPGPKAPKKGKTK